MNKKLVAILLSTAMISSIGATSVFADEVETETPAQAMDSAMEVVEEASDEEVVEEETVEETEIYEAGNLIISKATFPGDSMRSYVSENYDINGDGYLNATEIANVTEFSKNYLEISGIQYFTNLRVIESDCNDKLLDLSACTKLEHINLGGSGNLSTLKLPTNNKTIKVLKLNSTAITAIDVSNLSALEELDLSYNCRWTDYKFGALDLRKNTNLKILSIHDMKLDGLNIYGLTKLEEIYCYYTPFESFDFRTNTGLKKISAKSCELKAVNVSGLNKLEELDLSYNSLTAFSVTLPNLVELNLYRNNLSTATIKCVNLIKLYIDGNSNLERLAVGDCPHIVEVFRDAYTCGTSKWDHKFNRDSGIVVTTNHTYHVYKDGVCWCGKIADGLAKVNYQWGYYKGGKLQTTKTGIVQKAASTDKNWYFVKKGVFNPKANGIAQKADGSSTAWYYVKNGIYTKASGIAQKADGSSKSWYYVLNGAYAKKTGIAKKADGSSTAWYYVLNGIYTKSSGITKKADGSDATWYYVLNGVFTKNTGIAKKADSTDTNWYYVKAGIFTKSTGLARKADGSSTTRFYVKDGVFNKYTGKIKIGTTTYTLKAGVVQ